MRRIERSGVVVDHCTNCGGVFLDRGELEHLIQAENAYISRAGRGFDHDDDDDDDDGGFLDRGRSREQSTDRSRGDDRKPVKKKKRRGFLEDLLDFG